MKAKRLVVLLTLLTISISFLSASVSADGITLELSQNSFSTGDRLTLTGSVDAAAVPATDADVYLALSTPEAGFFCLHPDGGFGPANSAEPFLSNWTITDIASMALFTYQFSSAIPTGDYAWHLILNTTCSNALDPTNWLSRQTLPWTFSTAANGGLVLMSEQQRIAAPELEPGDLVELAAGNSRFAFDLYRQIGAEDEKNIFISPISISMALAMTWAGAEGTTAAAMADTLNFTLPADRLHATFNALDSALGSRGENAAGIDGTPFRLHLVNVLWGQEGYPFLPQFLDTLALNYGAGLRLLDFYADPDTSRRLINTWVEEQTENLIKDLLPPGSISSMTRLVLTNAIYFNAAWQHPFDPEATTQDCSFVRLNGSTATTPLMNQTAWLGYVAADGFQALELPYDGGEISMLILLPDDGRFEEFEEGLDAKQVESISTDLTMTNIRLAMPKFSVEYPLSLRDTLVALGMGDAFTAGAADFSAMDGSRELYIGDVIHKAFVTVDEEGTEAAAATAVIMELTSVPTAPLEVTLNRPFIFLIRDLDTGTILFLGRVTDPGE